MILSSPVFSNFNKIPDRYTCKGEKINPPLEIKDIPKNTQSLVLVMLDPDAPYGTFIHWLVWNISPVVKRIEEGKLPHKAVAGLNTKKKVGYFPPCPPERSVHSYNFILYALDNTLKFNEKTEYTQIEIAIQEHILAKSELTGQFGNE